ncbi:MAG: GPW/gp25 family protein [Bacteroidota bacterium]
MEHKNIAFLGTGWSFPPAFSKVRKSLELVSHTEDIRQSLEILLSTRPGERITQPDYGCDLSQLLYEPLTLGLGTYIKELVRTAILYFEPRILLERVDVKPDATQEGIVNIGIDYTIRATNTRTNYVYPFYLIEGTDL